MAELERAKLVLSNIDWSFSGPFSTRGTSSPVFDCRKHYLFPATFIPEIPYTLIEVLTRPGGKVLDPFAGLGTTLFQSLILGRIGYINETCRPAVEFARSLWILFNSRVGSTDFTSLLKDIHTDFDGHQDYTRESKNTAVDFEDLRPWFTEGVLNEIAYLSLKIAEQTSAPHRAAMTISLLGTLRSVCAQKRGWGYIADNVFPNTNQLGRTRNALHRFALKLGILLKDVMRTRLLLPSSTVRYLASAEPTRVVSRSDAREKLNVDNESIDLVVTSPPYAEMTDYALSQRLAYYWYGVDPREDVKLEIGARSSRTKLSSLEDYKRDMSNAIRMICATVRPGGYACFVMPSLDETNTRNTLRAQVTKESLSSVINNGLLLEQRLDRILPTGRRHHNRKWGRLERETIHIYRKPA